MPEAPRTLFFFLGQEAERRKKQPPFLFSQDGKKDGRAGIEHGFEKKETPKKTRTAERWRAAFERKGNGKYKREESVCM